MENCATYTSDYTLDARPDRIDLRDREYVPPLTSLEPFYPSAEIVGHYFSRYAADEMVLDQGKEGACTGFGLAAMINYLFWQRDLSAHLAGGGAIAGFTPPARVSMRMLYHLARFYDEWPGEDYEGSSCRGTIKAWHRHGVCSEAVWPYRDDNGRAVFVKPAVNWTEDAARRPLGIYYRINRKALADMQAALLDVGAVYASASVHAGWSRPEGGDAATPSHETLPLIPWSAGEAKTGGHAFALVGYNDRGFIVQNSWGKDWGCGGFALLDYDDWLVNGTDAWVCVLGVPSRRLVPRQYEESRQVTESALARSGWAAGSAGEGHRYADAALRPWAPAKAYEHSIVMGNDGRVINRLVACANGEDAVVEIAFRRPASFFGSGKTPRVVIYAHGGLNDEQSSIRRIRVMAPYFQANDVYPIFFTWKTGFCDSFLNILEDSSQQVFHRARGLDDLLERAGREAREVVDRTLEIACENLGIKAIWSQMKQNAAEASKKGDNDRGAFLLTAQLARLSKEFPNLEIHLVGHSAGSILLGHMLDDLARERLETASISLYAPACSLAFANRYYLRAVEKKVVARNRLHFYLLSSARERCDSVGPYGKSLLYLVSRALEAHHKTPLLGMIDAFDPNLNAARWNRATQRQLKKWQGFLAQGDMPVQVIRTEQVATARRWQDGSAVDIAAIDAAHGSFDNDVDVVAETLRAITGKARLAHRVENLRF